MDLEYISLHDTSGIHLQEYIGKTQKCMHAQKYLASGKEYIDPHKTRAQALRLWSECTDSTTLVYQRTNPAAAAAVIKKQRHYFANKGPFCQGYGFSSSHVWM